MIRWTPLVALTALTALPCLGQPLPPPVTSGYGDRVLSPDGSDTPDSGERVVYEERGTTAAPVLSLRRGAGGLVALDGPRGGSAFNWIASPFGRAISQHGSAILRSKTDAHRDAIDHTGVGTHYGDHSSFHDLSDSEKRAWIARNKVPGTNPPMPQVSSCIGWAMENVKAAYEAAGRADRWRQIERAVKRGDYRGTVLAKELEKDGWQGVYFNPDVTNTGSRGEHSFTASLAKRGKPYYEIGTHPDRRVIDYRRGGGSGQGMERLAKVPFWFGLAKGGTHTFVGSGTTVNEFHWADNPDNKNAIDETPLDEFAWQSGIIMVPPGTWQ